MMSRLTIEQLEYYRNTYDKFDGIDTNKFEEICDELIKYKQLQDELGCPLEVVFKALKEGFYTQTMHHTKQDNTWLGINDLGYTKEIFCMYFDNNMSNIETCVERDLKDYQKTWWLKGDRSE